MVADLRAELTSLRAAHGELVRNYERVAPRTTSLLLGSANIGARKR